MSALRFLLAWTLLAAALSAQPADRPTRADGGDRSAPLDRIVAVVNDEVITAFELQQRAELFTQQLKKQGTALPEQSLFQKQVLERLINDTVQLQLAKQTGVRVDDGQLDQALQRIARENNMDIAAFRATLEHDGVSFPKFRDDIRNEMILERLREREIDNKVVVTDAEVEAQLQADQSAGDANDEFLVSHILVTVPDQATPTIVQARRKRIAEALARAVQGEDFAKIAASYSEAPDAVEGGSLGWRSAARLPSVFVESVGKLKVGELSEIIRAGNGFHLLKLVDKRGKSVSKVVTQYKIRHILVRLGDNMPPAEAKNRVLQLKERIDHGEDFGNLARANSDDESKSRGGELNWISPGDTVPEFERTLEKLAPKQTAVVESPVGWHVVQLLERREADIAKDRLRLTARQAVRARKADEAFQDWIRQLRDVAYIEYRLDDRQ